MLQSDLKFSTCTIRLSEQRLPARNPAGLPDRNTKFLSAPPERQTRLPNPQSRNQRASDVKSRPSRNRTVGRSFFCQVAGSSNDNANQIGTRTKSGRHPLPWSPLCNGTVASSLAESRAVVLNCSGVSTIVSSHGSRLQTRVHGFCVRDAGREQLRATVLL